MIRNRETDFFKRRRGINKLQFMVVVISGVISLQWVVFQVIEYFFLDGLGENDQRTGIIFIIVAIALVFAVIEISRIKDTSIFKKPLKSDELNVYKEIIDRAMYEINDEVFLSLIQEQIQQEKWENVLRIGEVSSTLFWKMARYDIRIANGEHMITAIDTLLLGAETSRKDILKKKKAAVLIDDLGYTYVGKMNLEEAQNNIFKGLQIAEEIKAHDLACKAYRHLSGIMVQNAEGAADESRKKEHIRDALEKYRESRKELKWVLSPIRKIQLSAFLFYLLGRIKTAEENYTEAISEYRKAKRRFSLISDDEHLVKVFYQTGLAYELSKHSDSIVIKQYKTGYEAAIKLVDNEQILKNGCALCRIYSRKQNVASFMLYFNNVLRVATVLKNDRLKTELEEYRQKLNL